MLNQKLLLWPFCIDRGFACEWLVGVCSCWFQSENFVSNLFCYQTSATPRKLHTNFPLYSTIWQVNRRHQLSGHPNTLNFQQVADQQKWSKTLNCWKMTIAILGHITRPLHLKLSLNKLKDQHLSIYLSILPACLPACLALPCPALTWPNLTYLPTPILWPA